MKVGDIKVASFISAKTNQKVWCVSKLIRYQELFPGMKSEVWDQLKSGFATKKEATAWGREYKKTAS